MSTLPTGTVTFFFTDIVGNTRLWEQHPNGMREAMRRHDALVEGTVEAHGGQVVRPRGEGDSRFAIFARASEAVAAACALQQALAAEDWPLPDPLRIRLALHTGEADLRAGDYYGSDVNRCARLRSLAHPGQTLLSLTTAQLARDSLPEGVALKELGEHYLKDLTRPEHVFQLVVPGLVNDFPPLGRRSTQVTHAPDGGSTVGATATVLAGRRGRFDEGVELSPADVNDVCDRPTLVELVAAMDELGLPPEGYPYPRLAVAGAVVEKRWHAYKAEVLKQTFRAGTGGLIAGGIAGGCIPLLAGIINPEFSQEVTGFVSGMAWLASSIIAASFWGGLLGIVAGFTLGLVDALDGKRYRGGWRWLASGFAGLVLSALLIVFSLAGLLYPTVGPEVYIPVHIVYGVLFGVITSMVIPFPGSLPPVRGQMVRAARACGAILLLTIAHTYLLYRNETHISEIVLAFAGRFHFAWLFVTLLAFALSDKRLSLGRIATPRLENLDTHQQFIQGGSHDT
ncbi:MAG: adenylate/guanylate cyclase domain-containing protein [Chloroflexota bacterium]|nr:adenylate/guanylate cyclase domain-containing protein [Chloroflexota bacterium]